MPDLLLPPNVVREIQKKKWHEQRKEFRAKLAQFFDFEDPVCREWNKELRALDPLLRMGRARPLAYEPGWSVMPGFYHWVRDNETTAPTITPITGPDEEWREPDSGVLEELRRNDLQNPVVFAMLLEKHKLEEQETRKRKEIERQERQQEMFERYQAATRTQILTSPDVKWSQNAAGRRGKKS